MIAKNSNGKPLWYVAHKKHKDQNVFSLETFIVVMCGMYTLRLLSSYLSLAGAVI